MVNMNQNANEVIHKVRYDGMAGDKKLAFMIERIMARNGVNVGLHRPNYSSILSDYILQTEFPRGLKVPKFTKFSGDTSESTVEHVARYLIEAGHLANNKNLRIKYFPSSLTKNTFIWFTTLPASSIHDWTRLERLFHEQFYMGQSKISLKELASIKCKFSEPIDDYLNRFHFLKARCFAQVERLKAESARATKNNRREMLAYIDIDEYDQETDNDPLGFNESEIDLAKLKQGSPYSCKVLAPSNGKNPIEMEKNDKFPKKTYTFEVTKCDEIFDLRVKDGQMIMPPGAKIPPLEQQKK
ncbi:uncharacterized protein LOC127103689 [Lathyrus oleraceus]|uniref:uncharacterized protein LOC127103689 n=1 Tax=Pisum sativum TaxID=3888 RepID=UPI0021D014C8|nr:uncharacterized protein LOC127103689 [Pisum sativum]